MGLYDYIGEDQIKCFYTANCYIEDSKSPINPDRLNVNMPGGQLILYKKRNSVPYRTYYYNYTSDFTIFNFEIFSDGDIENSFVHIIKNGKVSTSYTIKTLPRNYNPGMVIDKYGKELNISTRNDLIQLIIDRTNNDNLYKKLQADYQINEMHRDIFSRMESGESIDTLKKGFELLNAKQDEILDKTFVLFNNKWYKQSSMINSNIIGPMINTSLVYHTNMKPLVKALQTECENKNKSLEDLILEYLLWQGDNALINEDKIRKILSL